jgi:hypothetical protein
MSAYDQAALEREAAKSQQRAEVLDAYKVLSRALNRGDEAMVLDAIRTEHSTLLGKLGNVVMTTVAERDGDGRLVDFNATLGAQRVVYGEHAKVSDVRQRFI